MSTIRQIFDDMPSVNWFTYALAFGRTKRLIKQIFYQKPHKIA